MNHFWQIVLVGCTATLLLEAGPARQANARDEAPAPRTPQSEKSRERQGQKPSPQQIKSADPFEALIQRIAELTRYTIARMENLSMSGQAVRKAVLSRTSWELKNTPQSANLERRMYEEAIQLPEAERLKQMNRFDEFIEIWAAPEAAGDSLRKKLRASEKPQRWHHELFYLGKDKGLSWYGDMTIYDFANIEKTLRLSGDDLIAAEIRGCGVDDFGSGTANSCEVLLGEEGPRALKDIDRAIANLVPQRGHLVTSMYNSRDPAVIRWLVLQSSSKDAIVAAAAKQALLQIPRAEATDLYLAWLTEGAGQREVHSELHACLEVKTKKAGTAAEKVLACPASINEYRLALELSRLAAGRSGIPEALLEQEKQIITSGYQPGHNFDPQKVKEAQKSILASKDQEAVAAIGITLALRTLKGDARAINEAGAGILQQMPGDQGKKLVALLARTNKQSYQSERIAELDRQLNGAQAHPRP